MNERAMEKQVFGTRDRIEAKLIVLRKRLSNLKYPESRSPHYCLVPSHTKSAQRYRQKRDFLEAQIKIYSKLWDKQDLVCQRFVDSSNERHRTKRIRLGVRFERLVNNTDLLDGLFV